MTTSKVSLSQKIRAVEPGAKSGPCLETPHPGCISSFFVTFGQLDAGRLLVGLSLLFLHAFSGYAGPHILNGMSWSGLAPVLFDLFNT